MKEQKSHIYHGKKYYQIRHIKTKKYFNGLGVNGQLIFYSRKASTFNNISDFMNIFKKYEGSKKYTALSKYNKEYSLLDLEIIEYELVEKEPIPMIWELDNY